MQREGLIQVVRSAVLEVYRAKGIQESTISEDTEIFGSDSQIDSLDLVGVVVALEQEVLEKTGKHITLVDENSLLNEDSPFRTVASLVKLAMERISLA